MGTPLAYVCARMQTQVLVLEHKVLITAELSLQPQEGSL